MQTNTIKGSNTRASETSVQKFLELTPYDRLQLCENEVKTLEESVLILDGEHINLNDRKVRLKEHVWQTSCGHKKQQQFMKNWSVRCRAATPQAEVDDKVADLGGVTAKTDDAADHAQSSLTDSMVPRAASESSVQDKSTENAGEVVSVFARQQSDNIAEPPST